MSERTESPSVEARGRLLDDLREERVIRAYLLGSRARGSAGPISDVDIAILPAPELPPAERAALQARLSLRAAAAFGCDHADVILLDEAPPALAFQAISGILLLDTAPAARIEFEARIMSAFHDRVARDARWHESTMRRYLRGEFA